MTLIDEWVGAGKDYRLHKTKLEVMLVQPCPNGAST